MLAWPAKDPDAVLDYRYNVPLDAGDTVETAVLTRLSGTVEIDSQDDDTAGVTAVLSGGIHGEVSVFKVEWTTTGDREDDDVITLAVETKQPPDLVLTGYVEPLAAHLIARYPAFAAVPISTIRYWLADAQRTVTTGWIEGDYAPAIIELAAHEMALRGLGTSTIAGLSLPAGLTRFKSGNVDLTFSESSVSKAAAGDYASTPYGLAFMRYLRRNRGGPLLLSAPYPAIAL